MLRFCYVAVAGRSMEPTLADGDWVLVRRGTRAQVGDVVVVEHPQLLGRLIVKRLARCDESGWWVLGDSPEHSTDSRHFGPVPTHVGHVVWRVRPWGRVR